MNRSSILRNAFLPRSFSINAIFVPASFLFSKWRFRSCLRSFFVPSFVPFPVPLENHSTPTIQNQLVFHIFTKVGGNLKNLSLRITFKASSSLFSSRKLKFYQILINFTLERNEKRNEIVPFFVPQFCSFRSCLVPFEKFDFRSCLVPQKKERVHERVPFGTRSFIPWYRFTEA